MAVCRPLFGLLSQVTGRVAACDTQKLGVKRPNMAIFRPCGALSRVMAASAAVLLRTEAVTRREPRR